MDFEALDEKLVRKIEEEEKDKKQRRRTFLYVMLLLALLILLVAAAYTWFSLSARPSVTDMGLYITSSTGLELAAAYDADDDDWGQLIEYEDLISEDYSLKPATWSQQQQSFLTVEYGFDGRISGYTLLNDEENSNSTSENSYYVTVTVYARTQTSCTVSLAEAVEVNEGENGAGTYVIGTPLWNTNSLLHDDGGQGAECAVRLGFMITKVNEETGEYEGDTVFYIYEPNCDSHADGSEGYVETASIDGTDTLTENLILQSTSSWSEADPVQREVTIKSLGEFTTDTELFSIEAGEVYEIKLYIWLEGQDIDCTNEINEAQIIASVQFEADYADQSGLQEIPY